LTNIAVGHVAPGFTLKSLDGKEYSLEKLLEKGPVVAAFFKISCPVCQFTFPYLQRLAERYSGDSATVIAISQDDARGTKEFNREYGVTFPTLLDGPGYPRFQCIRTQHGAHDFPDRAGRQGENQLHGL